MTARARGVNVSGRPILIITKHRTDKLDSSASPLPVTGGEAGIHLFDPARPRSHPESPYGHVTREGAMVPASRDELLAMAASRQPPPGVWTPETDGVVPPYRVPWIFERLMQPAIAQAWEQVKATGFLAALAVVLGGLAWVQAAADGSSGPPLLLVIALIWFGRSLMDWRQVRRMTPDDFAAEVEHARGLPRARGGVPVLTRALAAIIGVVAVAQLAMPNDLDAAGLVKQAVRVGEWWRLLTAPLMHGGLLHLVFNGMALLALGGLIERYAHRAFVPLVFLVTALAGGLGSIALYPNGTSVGASGGIMGMAGFALVLSFRRREMLPRNLSNDLLASVAWTAVMGLAAYQYIDNGAHGAGVLAGALMGLLMVPRGGGTPHWEPAPAIRAAGWVSLAVLAASAALAVAAMAGVV